LSDEDCEAINLGSLSFEEAYVACLACGINDEREFDFTGELAFAMSGDSGGEISFEQRGRLDAGA
jgi:hypothetical protein